jgi:hypothetical protein
MPEVRLTCLSQELKALVKAEMAKLKDAKARELFGQVLEIVAACPAGQQVGVEVLEGSSPGRRRKSDRPRTPYQEHTSACMKGGAKTLKQCAAEWRAKNRK